MRIGNIHFHKKKEESRLTKVQTEWFCEKKKLGKKKKEEQLERQLRN